MYKINQKQYEKCKTDLEIERQNEINENLDNQLYNHNNNYYHDNQNNDLQYLQQENLLNDIYKMHLIPPNCSIIPSSYTDYFNDDSGLQSGSPYKLLYANHPKDDKIYTKIEYRNFYNDWKKDALNYKRTDNKSFNNSDNSNNVKTLYNYNPNKKTTKMTKTFDAKLYEETKNKKDFAKPMESNGSNKLEYLYNDCLNKPTFDYKRFSSNILQSSQNDKPSQWVENQLYSTDSIEETSLLYNNYLNSRNKNASNIYETVFEDMYILRYNHIE